MIGMGFTNFFSYFFFLFIRVKKYTTVPVSCVDINTTPYAFQRKDGQFCPKKTIVCWCAYFTVGYGTSLNV